MLLPTALLVGASLYLNVRSDVTDQIASWSKANIAEVDGFALNVSNFYKTKRIIIDTSRNGNGSNGDWWPAYALELVRN